MRLGIVGHGFVGSAVNQGFTKNIQKFIVDPKYFHEYTIDDLVACKPDAVFVAVPTPQSKSGECDTSMVEAVFDGLSKLDKPLVIIKSTVPAYKLQELKHKYSNIRLVYNPEFLTEKNYINDFQNPPMHVFGGDPDDTLEVADIYDKHSVCHPCPVYHTDLKTASLVKYAINSFLATKVTFFNELYDVYQSQGGKNYEQLIRMISTDKRIGKTHMNVPGHNGERGYGGSCFPKDTAALAYYAREILDTPFTQLETSIKINNTLRKK